MIRTQDPRVRAAESSMCLTPNGYAYFAHVCVCIEKVTEIADIFWAKVSHTKTRKNVRKQLICIYMASEQIWRRAYPSVCPYIFLYSSKITETVCTKFDIDFYTTLSGVNVILVCITVI